MAPNTLPSTDENISSLNPQLEAEDDALSSGNTRLGLVVGALFLAGVLSYALVPKQSARALATVTPSFLLEAASVTGTREVPAAVAAAPAAPAEEVKERASAVKTVVATSAAARPAAPAALAAAPVAVAPAPAPAAPVEAAAPAAEAARPSTVKLAGRVLDEDGKPLAGATVLLKGSGKGTGTDANGTYELEVPAGDNILSVGYGGYQDEEVHARGSQPVNVTLTPTPGAKRRRK